MSALTAGLGRFVADLTLDAVPEKAREIAKTGIADCFGVMIAGSRDPAVALVDRELAHKGGKALASLFPSGEKREAADAALVNGVAAHVLDYDDIGLGGHPSAVLTPAILAQGEASQSTGAEILAAYIAGYETWAEILVREPIALHEKGWHPTAVRGAVAAAAAAAKLRRLNAAKTTTAIALSASMAGGIMSNFGTMTKSFHVGRAAQSGLLAVQLAEAGFTASPDALEHRSGFLVALSPGKPDLARPFDPAKKEWHILRVGLGIKRYPMCYATHRAIDGALDLIAQNNLKPDDVAQIHVVIGTAQALMVRNAKPQTGLEAKFSMQFAMASALVAHNVGLAQVTDEFVRKPEVQAIFPRLSIETTTAPITDGSSMAPFNSIDITTTSGKKLSSGDIRYAKGSFQKPVSRDELYLKFADCLGRDIPEATKSRAFENLMTLDRLSGIRDLALRAQ